MSIRIPAPKRVDITCEEITCATGPFEWCYHLHGHNCHCSLFDCFLYVDDDVVRRCKRCLKWEKENDGT